jgi:hypothetical protein
MARTMRYGFAFCLPLALRLILVRPPHIEFYGLVNKFICSNESREELVAILVRKLAISVSRVSRLMAQSESDHAKDKA